MGGFICSTCWVSEVRSSSLSTYSCSLFADVAVWQTMVWAIKGFQTHPTLTHPTHQWGLGQRDPCPQDRGWVHMQLIELSKHVDIQLMLGQLVAWSLVADALLQESNICLCEPQNNYRTSRLPILSCIVKRNQLNYWRGIFSQTVGRVQDIRNKWKVRE